MPISPSAKRRCSGSDRPTIRAHRGSGIERLSDGDKAHATGIEGLDDLGKVCQAASKAVYLIDNDRVDLSGLDVRQQAFECGAFYGATRVSAIVVVSIERPPSFLPLAEDVCLTGFALRVERVKGLFESLFGGLAGVNRTADGPLLTYSHLL
jgi:hypothetical protein